MKYIKLYEGTGQDYIRFNNILLHAKTLFVDKMRKYFDLSKQYLVEFPSDMSFVDDDYEYKIGNRETKKAFYNKKIDKNNISVLQQILIYKKNRLQFKDPITGDTLEHIFEINEILKFVKKFIKENPDFHAYGLDIDNNHISLIVEYSLKDHFTKMGNVMKKINK